MRLKQYFLLAAFVLAGCATPVMNQQPLLVNRDALLTQRAILTVHGMQFTFTGYLALSQRDGMRLIMMQSLGQVMADVLIKPDGSVFIMRPSPVLRREWLENYVAQDMRSLYGNAMTTPSHDDSKPVKLEHRNYTLNLQTVEVKPGIQPAPLFDETKAVVK